MRKVIVSEFISLDGVIEEPVWTGGGRVVHEEGGCMIEGRVIKVDDLPGGENAAVFDGQAHGSSVSCFITRNLPGTGPGLHRHPYDETFVIIEGEARFTVGEAETEAGEGDIVVVPPDTPHKFVNIGEGRLRMVTIHPRPEMETEWLEEA